MKIYIKKKKTGTKTVSLCQLSSKNLLVTGKFPKKYEKHKAHFFLNYLRVLEASSDL